MMGFATRVREWKDKFAKASMLNCRDGKLRAKKIYRFEIEKPPEGGFSFV